MKLVVLLFVAAMVSAIVVPVQSEAQISPVTDSFCNSPYIKIADECRVLNPFSLPPEILAWTCPPTSEPVTEYPISVDGLSFIQTCVTPASDGDGVPAAFDNCPDRWNASQSDSDGDGIGDACDVPDGVSLVAGNRSEGTPVTWSGCLGAMVRLEVSGIGYVMPEVAPGVYEKVLDARLFPDGTYTVVVEAECPNTADSEMVAFQAEVDYLDPSGLILNQIGQVLSGATVTLFHSPVALTDPNDPGFIAVPQGSSIMSDANRDNPVTTDAAGFYKWDTVAGWYVVSATAPGCMNPDGSGAEVRSAVLPVPPEQFNIDLIFDCSVLPTCNGLTVTLAAIPGTPTVGTVGADVILGTSGADVIDAGDGNDTVCAGDGDDIVVGGDGDDKLIGEAGRDIMRGGPGVDVLDGGPGRDRLLGGIGDDTLNGDDGDDYLGGFGGADTINGGAGNEVIYGGFGADTINGGAGNDEIHGLVGNDVISGGDGNDEIDGDRGNDTINGDAGDDVIRGGNASDVLRGGPGNDDISGGKADDELFGGADTDICVGNAQFVADTAAASCETVFGIP